MGGPAILSVLALLLTPQATGRAASPQVVFVCEHGAAKSLIGRRHPANYQMRATFRGVDPQDALSVRAVAGLKADGLTIPEGRPTAIGERDVAGATHIFAIGCALPPTATSSGTRYPCSLREEMTPTAASSSPANTASNATRFPFPRNLFRES